MSSSWILKNLGKNKVQTLRLKLKNTELAAIVEYVKYEEPRVIKRANILNALHYGYPSSQISILLNIDQKTVTNIGNVYTELGFEAALYDDERSGRPIDFDDRDRSRIIAMVCSDPPYGRYRWTLDLIVEEAQNRGLIEGTISREQVRIILQEHDLKPWREKMWCIGELDDEYIRKMEDVLDVYKRPYNEKKPMICVDEKPVPLISDIKDRIPAEKAGDILKKDYEYERGGSANVFCGVEPKAGVYINKVTHRRTGADFAEFLKLIAMKYKKADKIVLVMDNLSTHSEKSVMDLFGEDIGPLLLDRFEIHYTPKHGSWLNQAEIAIGMYSRQCLGDGRIGTFENLKLQTKAWNRRINKKKTKINWRFTKSKARKSLGYDGKHSEKLI